MIQFLEEKNMIFKLENNLKGNIEANKNLFNQ